MSDFDKFVELVIFSGQYIGVCALVMVALGFILVLKLKKRFLYVIVIIILFILTIISDYLLHSYGIIMLCLMYGFTVFVDHITYRFDLTYFMWLELLCVLAVILGLIGKYVLYGNVLQLLYAVFTTTLLTLFSVVIADRFLEIRKRHMKAGDMLLFLATTIGLFFVLYPKLFFIN